MVQAYLKIDRVDQAEKQLKACSFSIELCYICACMLMVKWGLLLALPPELSCLFLACVLRCAMQAMSALDDDATLTQLAIAWVDLFLVRHLHNLFFGKKKHRQQHGLRKYI